MYKKVQKRTFDIIEKAKDDDIPSVVFDSFIMILISLNVVSVFVETFQISDQLIIILKKFELFSIIVFTIEYLLRVWTAPCMYPDKNSIVARVRFIFSFMAVVDLLAIIPFYIPFIISIDLRILRALRLLRLARLLKLNRYTEAMKNLSEVLKLKSAELLSSIFIVVILMFVSSALMYTIEGKAQPETFNNAFSGLWWAIATFTTVGYGDIYPVTVLGKILGGFVSLLGIGLVAVPTGIITSGFMEINAKKKEEIDLEDIDLDVELEKLRSQITLIENIIKQNEAKCQQKNNKL